MSHRKNQNTLWLLTYLRLPSYGVHQRPLDVPSYNNRCDTDVTVKIVELSWVQRELTPRQARLGFERIRQNETASFSDLITASCSALLGNFTIMLSSRVVDD